MIFPLLLISTGYVKLPGMEGSGSGFCAIAEVGKRAMTDAITPTSVNLVLI
jgi:hypothetical protein